MELLLGIDAGTTSVKAGLFTPDGECLAIARYEYQLDTPQADRAELNPEIYWQACCAAVNQAIQSAAISPQQIIALSVSSQGETIITLDRFGKPIYPALIWLDNRAVKEAEKLAQSFADDVYLICGIPEIIPTWSACKILWLKENEPKVFAQAEKYLLVQDYLIYRLTGQYVSNASVACTSMLFDIVHDKWWQPVLDQIGISERQLPRIVPSGAFVGQVSELAAQQLNLLPTTKVIAGGMDQCVGAIGAGNIQPGTISETTGAALVIQATIPAPDLDKSRVIPVYSHSIPGQYLFAPVCPTAGMAYKWFRDTFGQPELSLAQAQQLDPFELLNQLAEEAPAGCDGLVMLPHLMGAISPMPNPSARGTFFGFTLHHQRAHFARAVLEGVAFLLKQNLERIEQSGIHISEIRSTGGGARSALWNQIKANVCGLPIITLENEETALLGNAILAGVASQVFPTVQAGVAAMVKPKAKIQPNQDQEKYIQPYQIYRDVDETLRPVFIRSYKG
ncbi:MAG: xylulokinase [Anaerolineales bacterium]